MQRSECGRCHGTGEIQHHRSRWIGGGRTGYRSEWTITEMCSCTPEPDPPAHDGREVIEVGAFEISGATVQAPGFEREGFLAFVERAKSAQLRTTPSGTPGTVMVLSGSSDARYAVTRQTCECRGHRQHGRCWHRAWCIWLADVAGVDVTQIPTIGISKRGLPLTTGRKVVAS